MVPHPEAGEDVSSSDALHAVLFDSGRPVLIAPQVAPSTIGTRVCVAWNGTAESAAAVLAALPWLKRAEAVRDAVADEYQRRGPAAQELAAYLALHDVHAELATFRPIDRDVGAGMLARGARVRRRPAGDGRLFPFAPAPAHPGRRDPARAGARRLPVLMNR